MRVSANLEMLVCKMTFLLIQAQLVPTPGIRISDDLGGTWLNLVSLISHDRARIPTRFKANKIKSRKRVYQKNQDSKHRRRPGATQHA